MLSLDCQEPLSLRDVVADSLVILVLGSETKDVVIAVEKEEL